MKRIFKFTFLTVALSAAVLCGANAAGQQIPLTTPDAQVYVQGVPAMFPQRKGRIYAADQLSEFYLHAR